ncbi:unnamed protein product [Clonostachys rosea]|uniref:Ubiquitin thioesterase OTU n=1 Tax=Bionectria ochroleuca TaxID=29856 RepID=A0ABY6UTJ7_BIOOC|nr:unnamed protein product [Clonostachys rosea]
MRARYRGPGGSGTLELSDDATVQALFDELRSKSGISGFSVKYGPPMAMKLLNLAEDGPKPARSLGLHGETLTIVPDEARPISPVYSAPPAPATSEKSRPAAPNPKASEKPEDINVPWVEQEGTLLLRVMPSDNSCLFTAFGGALPNQLPAHQLRRMMAEYILEHPDTYTEAVLGSPPSQYCASIQDPDRWGGGIELSILSSIFDIQICTFDVQAQNLINFGEDKLERCILCFSGVHYDRVALSVSDYPHTSTSYPPEMDRTIWPTTNDEVLEKTKELVRKLNEAHYYTDTDGLVLKCDVPGCDWIGSGQAAGSQHASETGHLELSEIKDSEEENVLRRCDTSGCDFMGQGERTIRQHRLDTGHKKFSIIPDW